jgi:uncharacterized membrane protein YhaH (DUF805 family)
MRVLPLLFDPRGAVDRRAFWSGLIQLTIVSVAVYAGLDVQGSIVALAAPPVIGETFIVNGVVGLLCGSALPKVVLEASVFLVAARLYVTACLMLKRSRDAGKGSRPLIAFGVVGLTIHGLMGLWAYDLFDDGMAVIVPLIADAMLTAALGLVFTVWLGAQPARATTSIVAGQSIPCPG